MGCLECMAEDGIVEEACWVHGEVGIGVALADVESFFEAEGDIVAIEFDAVSVDMVMFFEVREECAVATANIEDATSLRDKGCDNFQVSTERLCGVGGQASHGVFMAWCRCIPCKKARMMVWNWGSWRRKASWPLSVCISEKLTGTEALWSAWTI